MMNLVRVMFVLPKMNILEEENDRSKSTMNSFEFFFSISHTFECLADLLDDDRQVLRMCFNS